MPAAAGIVVGLVIVQAPPWLVGAGRSAVAGLIGPARGRAVAGDPSGGSEVAEGLVVASLCRFYAACASQLVQIAHCHASWCTGAGAAVGPLVVAI